MEKTLEVLNRLEAAGLIGRYAIMLKTGRPKGLIRLCQFLEEGFLQRGAFLEIVDRFSLREKWNQFVLRHFEGREPEFLIS